MTIMYVANATHQTNLFVYRVPENPKTIQQEIPAGGQIRIAANRGDLNQFDIDEILKLHRPYGMVSVDEVANKRQRGFCGLVYSLDKPVPWPKLEMAIMWNREVLIDRGRETRKQASVAISNQLQASINESGRGDVLREVIMEVEERSHTRPMSEGRNAQTDAMERDLAQNLPFVSNKGRPITEEGIRVTNDAAPQEAVPRRRRSRN